MTTRKIASQYAATGMYAELMQRVLMDAYHLGNLQPSIDQLPVSTKFDMIREPDCPRKVQGENYMSGAVSKAVVPFFDGKETPRPGKVRGELGWRTSRDQASKDAMRRLEALFQDSFEETGTQCEPLMLENIPGLNLKADPMDVLRTNPYLFEFKVGSQQSSIKSPVKENGRKHLRVSARRKLKLILEENKGAAIVENGKRKKEEDSSSTDNVMTKKMLLVESTSEVVGAAGLPHHEK